MATEQTSVDQVKDDTKNETKGQMTQRHKREVKVNNFVIFIEFFTHLHKSSFVD